MIFNKYNARLDYHIELIGNLQRKASVFEVDALEAKIACTVLKDKVTKLETIVDTLLKKLELRADYTTNPSAQISKHYLSPGIKDEGAK